MPHQDTTRRLARAWALGLGLAYVGLLAYSLGFVLTHGHVVQNRYTDSWWHMGAAEEYARTGVFAKDPFIPGAPRFAQFGLTEWFSALGIRCFGWSPRNAFVRTLACNVAWFFLGACFAGYGIRKRVADGCLCALVTVLPLCHHGVIGLGLPFVAAIGPLIAFMVWQWRPRSSSSWGSAFWRGALLGVVFDLHVFAGMAGCVAAALGWGLRGRALLRSPRLAAAAWPCVIREGGGFVLGFGVVAWRWIVLHVGLRDALSVVNAHILTATPAVAGGELVKLWVGGGLFLFVCLLAWLRRDSSCAREAIPWLAPLAAFTLVLVLLCIPPVSVRVARLTSHYMTQRLPALFPLGLVAVLAVSLLPGTGRAALASVGAGVLGGGLALGPALHMARLQFYLTRTRDFDRHPYEHLADTVGQRFRGQTILSDPWTSYYARGLLGTYAVTVPAGHGSPAVDYAWRDGLVRTALQTGPAAVARLGIHAVVLNKAEPATASFAGVTPDRVLRVWSEHGWQVAADTGAVVVLTPARIE